MTEAASQQFTFTLYKNGNNMHPIRKALKRRASYFSRGPSVEGNFWPVNLVWKPTWTNSRSTPAEKFSHADANPRRRAIVNHHRGVEPLCEKDRLFRALSDRAIAKGVAFHDAPFMVAPFVPPTFVLRPRGGNAADSWSGWTEFAEAFRYFQSQPGCRCLWLCKPANENRGIGIEVLSDLPAIEAFLAGKATRSSMGLNPTWVVQKYMESPLLIHGRKFDIRVWATVSDDGSVRVFGPGYIRTSSEPFTLDSNEAFVHLTNYCMQVKNKSPTPAAVPPRGPAVPTASKPPPPNRTGSFASHEPGNTLGFDDFAGYLDEFYVPHHLPLWEAGAAAPQAAYVGQPAGQELDCCGVVRAPGGVEGGGAPRSTADENQTGQHLLWDGPSSVWGRMRRIIGSCMETIKQPERTAGAKHGCTEYGFGKKPVATPQHRFELIGFDFMLDSALRPILIEVNSNPSVSYQAPWHRCMVDDMIQLLFAEHIDPILPPPDSAHAAAVRSTVEAARQRQLAYSHTPVPVRPARSGPSTPLRAPTEQALPAAAIKTPHQSTPGRQRASTRQSPAPRGRKGKRKFTDGTGIEYSPGDSSDSEGVDAIGDEDEDSDATTSGNNTPTVGAGARTGTGLISSPEVRRKANEPPWKAKFRERYPASKWHTDAINARNACIGWHVVCNIFKMKSPFAVAAAAAATSTAGSSSTSSAAAKRSTALDKTATKPRRRSGSASSSQYGPSSLTPARVRSGAGARKGAAAAAASSLAARVRSSPLGRTSSDSTPAARLLRAVSPIQVKRAPDQGQSGLPPACTLPAVPAVPAVPRVALAIPVSTIALGSVATVHSSSNTTPAVGTAASARGALPSNKVVASRPRGPAGVAALPSRNRIKPKLVKDPVTAKSRGVAIKLPHLAGADAAVDSVPPLVSPLRPALT